MKKILFAVFIIVYLKITLADRYPNWSYVQNEQLCVDGKYCTIKDVNRIKDDKKVYEYYKEALLNRSYKFVYITAIYGVLALKTSSLDNNYDIYYTVCNEIRVIENHLKKMALRNGERFIHHRFSSNVGSVDKDECLAIIHGIINFVHFYFYHENKNGFFDGDPSSFADTKLYELLECGDENKKFISMFNTVIESNFYEKYAFPCGDSERTEFVLSMKSIAKIVNDEFNK